jgi:hypothetical protein
VTIRKGEPWGTPVSRPSDLVVASSDAELRRLVAADPGRPYGLDGGDLFRSVGAPPKRDEMQRLPIDAVLVRLDDSEPVLAVAHVLARRGWWRGRLVIVANCGLMGEWDVAPRAHPNDGRVDVVEVLASMSIRSRAQARRRLPRGEHLPHPDVAVTAIAAGEWSFDRPHRVWIDGEPAGQCRRLSVAVAPDHFAIYV